MPPGADIAAMPPPVIPEDAPFSPSQRAWLNGFLAGLYGDGAPPPVPAEEFPWHDPALELAERLALAADAPRPRRLMAAMAQLDCGQCGYLCQTYAEALADGRETSVSLCVPGARPTARMLRQLLAETPLAAPQAAPAPAPGPAPAPAPTAPPGRPVQVRAATRLTGAGSAKDVRHVVIALGASGLSYEPGDSLAVAAPGDPDLVAACLAELGLHGDEPVPCHDGTDRPVREALLRHLDIARPLDRTLDLLAMSATDAAHARSLRRLADGEDDAEPDAADLLDLLTAFPSARPPLAALAKSLPALKPRLYSIASSPRAAPGEVHLCVSVVRTVRRGRLRHGTASAYLADRAVGDPALTASITTSHFRLPRDPATPVIMCGPGTGIAPFRAFLQERGATGARGRSWLFFGDRHQASDFLYRAELDAWRADGILTRLDTAFSRDQPHKIYVQDRMREHGADLWRWLQDGAHCYVCGDATRMARDVDAALRGIAMAEGRLDAAQAKDWMIALARQGRYLRDVY